MIDDATGGTKGIPLSEEMKAALTSAGLPLAAPPRGDNGKAGDVKTPGTTSPTPRSRTISPTSRPRSCCRCSRRATSRSCWCSGRAIPTAPSTTRRQPQHADARHQRTDLARRHQQRRRQSGATARGAGRAWAAATTDIIVTADHGFSTISKESKTSPAAKIELSPTRRTGCCRMGFVAIDLAKALELPLFDPDNKNARIADGAHPKARQRPDRQRPAKPDVVVAANGGSDLIYLPKQRPRAAPTASSRRCWRRIMSAASLSMTSSAIFPARCRCRRSS